MRPQPAGPSVAGRQTQAATRKLAWACLIAVFLLAIGGVFLLRAVRARSGLAPLAGYEGNVAVLEREYHTYYGRLMRDPDAERLFQQAAGKVNEHDYAAAVELMQVVAKEAAIPVVFNDLGVLLAQMDDRQRAGQAFREALARDSSYALVERNLSRLGGFTMEMASPVRAEVEPNNSNSNANLIQLGTAVPAEIADGTDDVDWFRFIAPAAPRDHVEIEIEAHSPTLELGFRMYGGDSRLVMDRRPEAPGGRLVEYIMPQPNTAWYLEIFGGHQTAGEYTVRVRPMKSFDQFEPNDDIFSAARLEMGGTVEANIMDIDDTDFYTFESPRSGTVTVDVESRSATLIPALTTFSSDKRNIGFGPDVRKPGENLHYTMEVQEHQIYYLQVWSQARTSGAYSLTVR